MLYLRNTVFLTFTLLFTALYGADVHFSNYNFSDAYLNPSLPSHIEEDIRVNVKYRSQWETVANGFQTVSGQFDISPLNVSNKFCGKKLVITPQIIHDRAGTLQKSTSSFNLNLSYSQFLDKNYKTQIAIGIQSGYTLNAIDLSKATFGSDYQNNGNSASLGNLVPNRHSMNLAAGASMAVYPTRDFNISGGFAAYNLLGTNVSFQENEFYSIGRRFTGFLNVNYQVNEIHSINGYAIVQFQKSFGNYQAGATWGANVGKLVRKEYQHQIFAGAGIRWQDAIIGTLGYQSPKYTVAFNYDFNYSKLISSSKSVGAFEISFAFATDWFKSPKKCSKPIPCSKFR